MKPRLLDLIVCPIDKTDLELIEWETRPVSLSSQDHERITDLNLNPALFSKEIVTAVLLNRARKILYPIYRGIPRLLVFSTKASLTFVEENAERIRRDCPGFTLPSATPMAGEETVLRTFSSEWVNYDWDGQSYWNVTPEIVYKSIRFMLGLEHRPVTNKLVLEVGTGVGGTANYMASSEGCELVGIDLSYAVESAYHHFGGNRFLHLIQASAFATPFRENTFDLVYSHGVLHHTFSTKIAFERISKLPKAGGRLYIWVYNPHSETRTWSRRIVMDMEKVIRPFCWRLPERLQTLALAPIIPLYFVHQNFYMKRDKSSEYIKYGWRHAMHAARDRFTPRYAHRHTEKEVYEWFREAGYTEIRSVGKTERPNFVPIHFVVGTAVEGIRHST